MTLQCLHKNYSVTDSYRLFTDAQLLLLWLRHQWLPWLRLLFRRCDGGEQLTVDLPTDFLGHALSDLSDELL